MLTRDCVETLSLLLFGAAPVCENGKKEFNA
jgi:hypothetical protein